LGYRIEFDPRAEKELEKLDREVARRILRFLRERVAVLDDPRSLEEALRGPELGSFWKYRVDEGHAPAAARGRGAAALPRVKTPSQTHPPQTKSGHFLRPERP